MKIGEKIKQLRIKNELTQEELADRAELSKGFISQLERDMTSPSIQSLTDLLECLGTNMKEFFSDQGDERVVFGKNDFYTKQYKEDKYEIEWIIPNAQKNNMEPILLTFEQDGVYDYSEGHSGEEFGYVISGSVLLDIEGKEHKVHKGETFYYSGSKSHIIKNRSKTKTQVLLVSSPPSF